MDKLALFSIRGEFLRMVEGNFALGFPYIGGDDPAAFGVFTPKDGVPQLGYYVPRGTVKIAHLADDAQWYPQNKPA